MDTLIADSEAGGKAAALRLRESIWNHLGKSFPEHPRDMKLVIHIYANLRGLSKAYCDSGILKERDELDRFVCGFNKEHPFCHIIDAGNGKECSDYKIRETFNWHGLDPRCQHIIFGGSADNGYARMLGPYAQDKNKSDRITLLEGPPFANEIIRLADNFDVMSDAQLFRDTKITTRPMAIATKDRLDFKAPSWANTLSTPIPPGPTKTNTIDISPIKTSTLDHQDPSFIAHNAQGQRVDPFIKTSSMVMAGLKGRKLCNNHHIFGYCAVGDHCEYAHGKLDEKNLNALRQLARSIPCKSGVECDDEDCYYGHRCPHGDCDRRICKFGSEMHNIDTKVVNAK